MSDKGGEKILAIKFIQRATNTIAMYLDSSKLKRTCMQTYVHTTLMTYTVKLKSLKIS